MKPTPEQVVAHFGLPAEAVGSKQLQAALISREYDFFINVLAGGDEQYRMNAVAWSFGAIHHINIRDYFKPNNGLEDSQSRRDEHS